MAVVAFSAPRLGSQEELQPFERLIVGLSTAFSALDPDSADAAVARALEDVGVTLGVDDCTLIAFHERGGVSLVHSWAAAPHAPYRDDDLTHMTWLVQRLARNSVVVLTPDMAQPPADDRPVEARPGAARLAVSIVLGTRVAYGLIVGRHQLHSEWRTPFIDRLRAAGEIIAAGLERRQLEDTRRSNAADPGPPDRAASADMQYLRDEARNRAESDQIIGESPAFRTALSRLGQVAPLDATVLLLGETGTGKELFARALHERSRRRARTLIRVNCAALPASLIESELFGHERGAFTGAVSTRQGRFELADGGTIFLDEIGDLAPELQAKLLRVLQEGEFERVGSSKTRRVDVRVITATHINLEEAVAAGRFRADLYYRLSVFPIQLPSLRERREDIPQLVWFFIHRRQRELCRRIERVPAAVMQALQYHEWPGNVRELENVVERAMIRSADGTLQLDDPLRVDRTPRPVPAGCTDSLDGVQREHIERVLRECGGRINGPGNAAERLGIHPNTLRFRIKKLGVDMPERKTGRAPLHKTALR
jgi:transcriptional regulator with GAF, ATPase, and Fis domain